MGLIYVVAKAIAKMTAKSATKDINKLVGVKVGKDFVWSYKDKIADLSSDHGISVDYVRSLITDAKDPASLNAIKEYLQSNRNDLPNNVTQQLLSSIDKKMPDLLYAQHLLEAKQQWIAEHAQQTIAHVIDAAKEMM